jgi:hypothetical protein
LGKRVAAKTWNKLIKGVDFNNHEESYNFYLNLPACLICDRTATHWISSSDDWQMPACGRHYHNRNITKKRWAKARVEREAIAKGIADVKCYKCGKKPVKNFITANEAEGWITLDNNAPVLIPLCEDCYFDYIWSLLE